MDPPRRSADPQPTSPGAVGFPTGGHSPAISSHTRSDPAYFPSGTSFRFGRMSLHPKYIRAWNWGPAFYAQIRKSEPTPFSVMYRGVTVYPPAWTSTSCSSRVSSCSRVRRPFVRCAAPEFVRYAKVYSGRIVGTPPVLSLCPPCYWGFPPGFWCDLVSPKIRRNCAIIKPRQGLIRRYLQGRKCSYRTLFPCPGGRPVDPPEQALVEVGGRAARRSVRCRCRPRRRRSRAPAVGQRHPPNHPQPQLAARGAVARVRYGRG